MGRIGLVLGDQAFNCEYPMTGQELYAVLGVDPARQVLSLVDPLAGRIAATSDIPPVRDGQHLWVLPRAVGEVSSSVAESSTKKKEPRRIMK